MVNYSFTSKFNHAKAAGTALPASLKQSIEICNFIRNRSLLSAKKILTEVIEKKRAIPFRKFLHSVGHKTGMMAGRYPKKACGQILKILDSAEANAQANGLNSSNLFITHISANKGITTYRFGRKRGLRTKRTNIWVVLEEVVKKSPKNGRAND